MGGDSLEEELLCSKARALRKWFEFMVFRLGVHSSPGAHGLATWHPLWSPSLLSWCLEVPGKHSLSPSPSPPPPKVVYYLQCLHLFYYFFG